MHLACVGLIGDGIKSDRGGLPDLDMIDIDLNHLNSDHQVGQVINPKGLCPRRDNCVGDCIRLGDRSIERGGELERIQVLLCGLDGQLGLVELEQICPGGICGHSPAGQGCQVDLGVLSAWHWPGPGSPGLHPSVAGSVSANRDCNNNRPCCRLAGHYRAPGRRWPHLALLIYCPTFALS